MRKHHPNPHKLRLYAPVVSLLIWLLTAFRPAGCADRLPSLSQTDRRRPAKPYNSVQLREGSFSFDKDIGKVKTSTALIPVRQVTDRINIGAVRQSTDGAVIVWMGVQRVDEPTKKTYCRMSMDEAIGLKMALGALIRDVEEVLGYQVVSVQEQPPGQVVRAIEKGP